MKKEIAAGTAVPSFTSQYLAPEGGRPASSEVEDLVLWTAAALYVGAFDTVGLKFLILHIVPHGVSRLRRMSEHFSC